MINPDSTLARADAAAARARVSRLRWCKGGLRLAPRAFISGNNTGATAAMSAALEPEMPDTKYIAPTST